MKTTLTLLGTGSPGCFPNVYQTSMTLVVDETPIVIDCGGGTVQRLASACAAGQPTLAWGNLKTLILTHLHPDHSAGLADFIISTWIRGRQDIGKRNRPQAGPCVMKWSNIERVNC